MFDQTDRAPNGSCLRLDGRTDSGNDKMLSPGTSLKSGAYRQIQCTPDGKTVSPRRHAPPQGGAVLTGF